MTRAQIESWTWFIIKSFEPKFTHNNTVIIVVVQARFFWDNFPKNKPKIVTDTALTRFLGR